MPPAKKKRTHCISSGLSGGGGWVIGLRGGFGSSSHACDRSRNRCRSDRLLTLRELELASGAGLAVLLAFDLSRVTGEIAVIAQDRFQARVAVEQRPRHAEQDRLGLSGDAAAVHLDKDIDLVGRFRGFERGVASVAVLRLGEEVLDALPVDGELAAAGADADASSHSIKSWPGRGARQSTEGTTQRGKTRRLPGKESIPPPRLRGRAH